MLCVLMLATRHGLMMYAPLIHLITTHLQDQPVWHVALQPLAASINLVTPARLQRFCQEDLCVVVLDEHASFAPCARWAPRLGARTLLVSPHAHLAWRLAARLPQPVLVSDTQTALRLLPDHLQLLHDITSGRVHFAGDDWRSGSPCTPSCSSAATRG
jgi:GAF domain-containing protein